MNLGGRRRGGGPPKQGKLDSASQQIVELIVKVGDSTSVSSLGSHLLDLASTLLDPSRHQLALDTLFRCIVALPTKTALYATVASLVCAEKAEFSDLLLARLKTELSASLLACDYYATKFLLRFIAELANCNCIPIQQAHALYEIILTEVDNAPHIPQHIPDYYIHIILSCLALGYHHERPTTLLGKIEKLMQQRRSTAWLTPFQTDVPPVNFEVRIDTLNYAPDMDSLQELYRDCVDFLENHGPGAQKNVQREDAQEETSSTKAQQNTKAHGDIRFVLRPYQLNGIFSKLFGVDSNTPRPTMVSSEIDWFEFEALNGKSAADLITFKAYIDHENETRIALMLEPLVYPDAVEACHFTRPKPLFYIFPKSRTMGDGKEGLQAMEKFFFEDYATDVIHFFRTMHSDIPKHVNVFSRHLAEYFDFEALVVEMLLKDLLNPLPPLYPGVHYGTVLLEFIQRNPAFVQTISEAVDRLFCSLPNLQAGARAAFADWLSFHLANNEFKWHWKEWAIIEKQAESERGASSKMSSAVRPYSVFIQEVLSSMARLSFYDRIAPSILAAVPDCAERWLPKKPEPVAASGFYAHALSQAIHEKAKQRSANAEDILQPVLEYGLAVPLTSEQVLQSIMRAVLAEGSASITLLQTTFSKYHEVLHKVAYERQENLETPTEGGRCILQACMDYYEPSPQHFTIGVLSLLHRNLISPEALAGFLLNPEAVDQITEKRNFWWDLVSHTLRHALQSYSVPEAEITNKWAMACKLDQEADPLILAQKLQSEKQEVRANAQTANDARAKATPLASSIFTSLIDMLAIRPEEPVLQQQFVALTLKHRKQFLSSAKSILDPIASTLSANLSSLYNNTKFMAENY